MLSSTAYAQCYEETQSVNVVSTHTTITVTWSEANLCNDGIILPPTQYNIHLYSDGIHFYDVTSGYTITGLTPETSYYVTVEATFDSKDAKFRVAKTIETLATPIIIEEPEIETKSGGSCSDCTPPTLGLNTNYFRVVDNGFSYNNNSTMVKAWHTEFPLITAIVGETNTVEIIVYENGGINNMDLVQFGLGATEIGVPLNDLEVLIEVYLETFGTLEDIAIENIIISDSNNLIENSTVVAIAMVTQCQDTSLTNNCINVILQYSYREPTINNVMVVNVQDKNHNSQNFYFNDGVTVIGESLNESPTHIIYNKHSNQQTENLTLTLTRTDKVNHIWEDKYGVEYLKVSDNRFDRITPQAPMLIQDTDPNSRNSLVFKDKIIYEQSRAENYLKFNR